MSHNFSQKIIKRTPDKQIVFVDGFLIVAFQTKFVYINTADILNQDHGDKLEIEKELEEDQFDILDLEENNKIIAIQEISNQISCLVIENLDTRIVSFMSI